MGHASRIRAPSNRGASPHVRVLLAGATLWSCLGEILTVPVVSSLAAQMSPVDLPGRYQGLLGLSFGAGWRSRPRAEACAWSASARAPCGERPRSSALLVGGAHLAAGRARERVASRFTDVGARLPSHRGDAADPRTAARPRLTRALPKLQPRLASAKDFGLALADRVLARFGSDSIRPLLRLVGKSSTCSQAIQLRIRTHRPLAPPERPSDGPTGVVILED